MVMPSRWTPISRTTPRYLPGLFTLAQENDLVIGSRYVPGGGTTGCTMSRVLLSQGANGFAKFMLGLKAHDCTAGFRCYRAEVVAGHRIGYDLFQRLFLPGRDGHALRATRLSCRRAADHL